MYVPTKFRATLNTRRPSRFAKVNLEGGAGRLGAAELQKRNTPSFF